jgi:hypothetical protein
MWWLARARLVLARRPWLYWLIAGCIAAPAGLQVWSAHDDAVRARTAWGTTRAVWVVAADTAAGAPVVVERHDYPSAVLAGDVVDDLPPAPVAARALARGTVLTTDALIGSHALAPDWVVVALSAEHAPSLLAGDDVSLFSAGTRLCDGTVAAATADRVEVGVPPDCAAQVSSQLAAADILVTRRASRVSRRT